MSTYLDTLADLIRSRAGLGVVIVAVVCLIALFARLSRRAGPTGQIEILKARATFFNGLAITTLVSVFLAAAASGQLADLFPQTTDKVFASVAVLALAVLFHALACWILSGLSEPDRSR